MSVRTKKRPYSGPAHKRVLLYKLSGRPTGRQIAGGLGIPYGTCYYFQNHPPGEVVIRWGGAQLPEKDAGGCINPAAAIRLASGKLGAFRKFREADVPIPRFSASRSDAAGWETVVFGRSSEGFQGRGIRVYQPGEPLGNHDLFTEYIPNEREYRLHVIGGVVVSIQRKYPTRSGSNGRDFIKNHGHGYEFKTPEKDLNSSRKEAAIHAVECLGLDFGAVDLIVGDDGKEYVLEVNTAPALSPMRVEQYLAALRPMLAAR